MDRLVLTVSELAEALGIGRNAAYRLANSDQLRTIKVGRSIRIPRSALQEFLQERRESDRELAA